MKAKFEFTDVPANLPKNSIVIRDIGETEHSSIYSDAGAVVETLLRIADRMNELVAVNQPGLYFYDADGGLTQLNHNGVGFEGFGVKTHG